MVGERGERPGPAALAEVREAGRGVSHQDHLMIRRDRGVCAVPVIQCGGEVGPPIDPVEAKHSEGIAGERAELSGKVLVPPTGH